MPLNPEKLPVGTPLVDSKRFMDDSWVLYFNKLVGDQVRASTVLPSGAVTLTGQGAAISTTTLASTEVQAGLYRISYDVRVTRPGTVSSTVTVTLSWTDLGQSLSITSATLNGNLVTTRESRTEFVYVDAGGPVTYSTTYASAGATSMQYALRVGIERYHA